MPQEDKAINLVVPLADDEEVFTDIVTPGFKDKTRNTLYVK
jgi:hypothetical protein